MGAAKSKVVDIPETVELSTDDMPFAVGDVKQEKKITFVCISDTHNLHKQLRIPKGDVLLVCGDVTNHSKSSSQIKEFNEWLGEQEFEYKIFISGNHEKCFKPSKYDYNRNLVSNATHYLQDSSAEVYGIKIWGSPWHVKRDIFHLANSFGLTVEQIKKKWNLIPEDTDILLTHFPPFGIRDDHKKKNRGCSELLQTSCNRVKPKVHVFGHVHERNGGCKYNGGEDPILFLNVAQICAKKPVVFEYYIQSDKSSNSPSNNKEKEKVENLESSQSGSDT